MNEVAISAKEDLKLVFSKHYRTLVLFANRFLHSLEASEDVVQSSLVKLWKQDKTFANHQALKSYLYTMVRNASLNVLEQEKVKNKYQQQVLALNQVEEVKDQELADIQKLYAAIQDLSERRKQVILYHLKEYSNTEIADHLAIKLQTVKNLKRLAYEDIKAFFKS